MRKVIWSPVEIDYLKLHKHIPINQLTVALAKSRSAINTKLLELDGKVPKQSVKKGGNYSKIGKRPDCDNLFFRSAWEANVFRLLRLNPSVQLIEYEPTDFTFWQFGIKKGTVSYTPDFKVTYKNGNYEWIEIKGGWLKAVDKTKLRRFKKFYPEEWAHLVAVTPGMKSKTALFFMNECVPIKWIYPEINKQYKNEIPNWE